MATELDGKYTVKLDPDTDIMRSVHLYNYFFKYVEPLIYGEPRNEITFSKYRFHLNITGEIFEFGLVGNTNIERIDDLTLRLVKLSKEDTDEMQVIMQKLKSFFTKVGIKEIGIGPLSFTEGLTSFHADISGKGILPKETADIILVIAKAEGIY